MTCDGEGQRRGAYAPLRTPRILGHRHQQFLVARQALPGVRRGYGDQERFHLETVVSWVARGVPAHMAAPQ
jgi:hypothetical protein